MQVLSVRGCRIGEGRPKIIVPIVARSAEQTLAQARLLHGLRADIVEWRADHLLGSPNDVLHTLTQLRAMLSLPLLFTLRTRQEGGEAQLSLKEYLALCLAAAAGGADMVDIELCAGDEAVRGSIAHMHAAGALAVVSEHHFDCTPPQQHIVSTLAHMQALGADIPKLACMPQSMQDVLTLLQASAEFAQMAQRPFIAISMGALGTVSRIAGETFGSALTFGTAQQASAPGQLPADTLRLMLDALHHGR